MRLLSLIHSVDDLPSSSLAQMIGWAMEAFGAARSSYAIGAHGVDVEAFVNSLRDAERDGEPVCVLATTGALLRVLDYCRAQGLAFRLPHGSRLMDTGGDKGRAAIHVAQRDPARRVGGLRDSGLFLRERIRHGRAVESVLRQRHRRPRARPPPRAPQARPALDAHPGARSRHAPAGGARWARGGSATLISPTPAAPWRCCRRTSASMPTTAFSLLGRAAGAELRGCSLNAAGPLPAEMRSAPGRTD